MLRRQVLTWQSGRFEPSDSVPGREEVSHPPVVAQDTIDDLSSPGHDLARDPDQILEEGAKLHSQKLIATLTLSDHQREPGFEVPRQGGHDHVSPVAHQVVDGHPHGVDPVLELFNHVFLIAPSIGQPHDFRGRKIFSGGNVEEIALVIEQGVFAAFDAQVLFEDHESTGLPASSRTIRNPGNTFTGKSDVFEAALPDDPAFTFSRFCLSGFLS